MKQSTKSAKKTIKGCVLVYFIFSVFATQFMCPAHSDYIRGVVVETKDLSREGFVNKYHFTAQISGSNYNIEITDQQGQKIAQIGSLSDQECVAVNFSNPAVLNGSNVYSASVTSDNFPLGGHDSVQVVWLALIMSDNWMNNSTLNGHYPLVLTTQLMERKLPFAEAEIPNVRTGPSGLIKRFTLHLPPVLYMEEIELKSLGISNSDFSRFPRTTDNRVRVPVANIKNSYPFLKYESEWDEGKKHPRSATLTRFHKPDGLGGPEKPMATWEIKFLLDQLSDSTVEEVQVPALVTVHDHRFIDNRGIPKTYLLNHEAWPRRDSAYYHRLKGEIRAERKGGAHLSTKWAVVIISCLAVVPVLVAIIRTIFNKGDSRTSN